MTGADPGLRNHVARVAHGSLIMLLGCQEALDDIEGGVPARQWQMVAAQTRHLVLLCCHVRSLATGGEPYLYEDGGATDPWTYLSAADVDVALGLIHDTPGQDDDTATVATWLERLRRWVADTETVLGLDERLPVLRSPEGLFGALRLARGWIPLVDELGLPPLLPAEWTRPL